MKRKLIFTLLLILVLCNISIAQTIGEKFLKLQEGVEREKLIDIFVRTVGSSSFYTCMPVFVSSDTYTGYAIITEMDLFNYYKSEIFDSSQSQTFSMKNYHAFAKNLLLKRDTIKLGTKELYNRKPDWEFKPFTIIDSIINYPEEKKQELIDLAFGEDGFMIDSLYQPGSLILKLLEWDIFMLYQYEWGSGYRLFYYKEYDRRIGHEPADMINDCLIRLFEHINKSYSGRIYVLADFYPYSFDFRQDADLIDNVVEYVSLEELKSKESDDTTLSLSLKKGIRVVYYDGIFLENDALIISFFERILFMNDEGLLTYHPTHEIKSNFIYQYSPVSKKWNFIEARYDHDSINIIQLTKNKWCGVTAPDCITYIIFKQDYTYEENNCERELTFEGKYEIVKDSIFLYEYGLASDLPAETRIINRAIYTYIYQGDSLKFVSNKTIEDERVIRIYLPDKPVYYKPCD